MAWIVQGNIKGPQGDQGIQGDQGDPGTPGDPGADGSSVLIQGDVADYASLPGGLGASDKGKAWLVLADGKLYEWDGAAFPSNGNGATFRGPQGIQGVAGEGIAIAGSVANYAALPGDLGAEDAGDGYLVLDGGAYDDGLLYIWDGDSFPAEGSGVAFQGPPGEQGVQGDPGTPGADGYSVALQGDVANYASLPGGLGAADKGKTWLNLADGKAYQWNGSAFPADGSGTTWRGTQGATGEAGADGDDGADGARGSLWYTGAGSPGTIGGQLPGDLYLDTTDGSVYQLS